MNLRKEKLCIVCSKQTNSSCAKCGSYYCSKDCQVMNWSKHKLLCQNLQITQMKYEKAIELTNILILGNVFTIASQRPPGVIVVCIKETIDEYIVGPSLHFAYISHIPYKSNILKHKYNINMPPITNGYVNTIYILNDYYRIINNKITVDLIKIKNKSVEIVDESSIIFTL